MPLSSDSEAANEMTLFCANLRKLRLEEISLICHILINAKIDKNVDEVASLLVCDQDDGGMGSISIFRSNDAPIALDIDARYVDVDGIEVLIRLSLDEHQNLIELDSWKVDFSPLKKYPTPDLISII